MPLGHVGVFLVPCATMVGRAWGDREREWTHREGGGGRKKEALS